MKSDQEFFALDKIGKGRKLKFGESGDEPSDLEAETPVDATVPAPPQAGLSPQVQPQKQALAIGGNDVGGQEAEEPEPPPSDITPPLVLPKEAAPLAQQPSLPKEATSLAASKPIGQVGHDGTANGLTREQWRDKWMSSGARTIDDLKRFLAENGGEILSDNGSAKTPFGESLDLLANARTGNGTPAWTQYGAASDGPGSSLEDVIAGGGATTPNGGDPVHQPPVITPVEGSGSQSLAELMASDPAIAANKRSLSRSYGDLRAQAAEQSAVGGQAGSGAFAGKTRQLAEDEADAAGDFAGNRVAQAQQLQAQQENFSKSLGFNYAQLSQQQKQFMSNLGQNRDQFLQSLGLSYAQLSAQQKMALQQLQQQADQFNKSLGFNYDQLEADQNNHAVGGAS